MIKEQINRIIFVLFVLGFNHGAIKAQKPVLSIDELKDSFRKGVTEQYQEKVYIHTDREMYITGETIWLKPYCVDATFHTQSNISKVVNIELFDEKGNVVKQERVQLDKGVGEGQLFVSPDMQTGTYVLRAYTNWMKNFDTDFSFSKRISIINPSITQVAKKETQKDSATFLVEFFPEGGDLVQGLESKIAVKANDLFGKGIRLTGVVFDNEENEVAKFNTTQNGLSSFQLAPIKGKTYKARVAIANKIYTWDIPKARDSGLIMDVETGKENNFNITIKSTQDFLQTMYLIAHTRGVINKFEPLYPNISQSIKIESDGLKDGITHITILDSKFAPIAERLVFKYPNSSSPFEVKVDKKSFAKREKVTLTIDTKQPEYDANISVSVFRTDSVLQMPDNIVSNLLLTSDLKGIIPNAGNYFREKNKNNTKQLDLIMLTNGWRRFDWEQISNQKRSALNFPAEMYAPIISGQLSKNANSSFPESLQISFRGEASFLNSVEVNDDGSFHLEAPFRIKNDKVILFINNDTLTKNQVTLFSPFDYKYNIPQKTHLAINTELKKYAEALNTNIQISQIYRTFNFINGVEVENQKITSGFYGQPDYVYRLDDYTRFETVEDLFIEYVRFAYIKKKNKKKGFYILRETGGQAEALVTIDGVPIFDSEFVLGFDPLKVEKLSMINNFYFIGDTGYNGLINFSTYNGDFNNEDLPDGLIELAYDAIQSPRRFYSPNYEINGNLLERIPDYRNTLYWNPNFSINNGSVQIEFYTSDDSGVYQIQMEGITEQGEPFYKVELFYVEEDTLP